MHRNNGFARGKCQEFLEFEHQELCNQRRRGPLYDSFPKKRVIILSNVVIHDGEKAADHIHQLQALNEIGFSKGFLKPIF